ncbi:MAG: hypothetical protein DRG78_14640 [Epsilonproteobacteria bacterium]|nr:MAG: hypothetical protein DRG78_14640 [Campylobacterota bacterium]
MSVTVENTYWDNTVKKDGFRYTQDSVETKNSTGADGNSYTTAISNDKLSNEDFLRLMLEEMKMQDPTKPMDSSKLMDSQLQMSTIETNQAMAKSMEALTKTYGTSSLTNAMNLMGKHIEGNISVLKEDEDDKVYETLELKSFKVETIETIDGKVTVNAREMTGYEHSINILGEANEDGNKPYIPLDYDKNGNIKDEDGKDSDVNVKITNSGAFELNSSGRVNLYDNDQNIIDDAAILDKYKISPAKITYAEELSQIALDKITKVF